MSAVIHKISYRNILSVVLSEFGDALYLNGESILLSLDNLRDIIDSAISYKFATANARIAELEARCPVSCAKRGGNPP